MVPATSCPICRGVIGKRIACFTEDGKGGFAFRVEFIQSLQVVYGNNRGDKNVAFLDQYARFHLENAVQQFAQAWACL